jgi:hypothetical protein
MRRITLAVILAAAMILSGGCGSSPETGSPGDRPVATINDYHLSREAFQRQLASELELDPAYKLTDDAKRRFLDSLIRKELLIQEAVRLKLDREPAFTAAIEKYWEATLIRDLLDRKGREISGTTTVTEAEIEARYAAMRAAPGPLPPPRRGLS